MFYRVGPAEGYEWVFPAHGDDYNVLASLDGSSRAGSWEPVNVYRATVDERQPGWAADFPWCTAALVVTDSALAVVGELLASCCEVLPLSVRDSVRLHVVNVPIIACLDEAGSVLMRFRSGRVMGIEKVVLDRARVGSHDVFRVYRGSELFVSERFFETVRKANLSGLTFERVAAPATSASVE